MQTAGAYSLGDGVTSLSSATLSADLGPSTTLRAFVEHSTTENYDGHSSLFASDSWNGSRYGLALTQSSLFGLNGNFRLTLVRPWQLDNGSLNVHIPVGRELDGSVDYQDRLLSVAADRNPLEIGLGYLFGRGRLKYGAEMRMLNHDVASQSFSEYSIAGALGWSF
jgi:hypothetical protein